MGNLSKTISHNRSIFAGIKKLFGIVVLVTIFGVVDTYAQHLEQGIHDPVMIQQDNTYYLFGTGGEIHSSPDMQNWQSEGEVFDEGMPDWVYGIDPDFDGSYWAPDITYHNGTYYLYYSISQFGRNNSAVGLATNTTLNPDDSDYEWVDQGIVVRSIPGRDMWNAIDPNLTFDDEGTPWLTFGSFWNGIKLVQLEDDLKTIAQTPENDEWHTIASRHRYWKLDERDSGGSGNPELNYEELYSEEVYRMNRDSAANSAIEAPFIFKKNGYYYLFVSWDRCCRGEESTYKVMVGRSKDITGPYLDRKNLKMEHEGGTLVISGDENYAGIGHNSAYTFNGTDYLVAHAYDLADDGDSKLMILEMKWDEDDWPVVKTEQTIAEN